MQPPATEGHRLFRRWRAKSAKTNQELGKEFHVDGAQVSRWTTTDAQPDLRQIMAMWKGGPKIHPSKWLEAAKPEAEEQDESKGAA